MENDTRKIHPKAQEVLRKKGIDLIHKGYKSSEVAKILGVHSKTVHTWRIKYEKFGITGLKSTKRGIKKGSTKKLKNHQCALIVRLIKDKHPEQLKLPFVLWTRQAVQELIYKKFKIKLAITTVGNYLRSWGFSSQKPLKKAYEQQPEKVKKWLKDEYPVIKKRSKKEKAEIQWCDETGFKSDSQVLKGYAPIGQTPILKKSGSRFSLNMISSITNQGQVRFMIYDSNMNAKLFLIFIKRLIKSSKRKIFLIVDNLRVHHAILVNEWVEENKEKIELFFLPPYSPELNPDEYLNCDIKTNANAKRMPKNKKELKQNLKSHMMKLQKRSNRVKSYFKNKNIKYAS